MMAKEIVLFQHGSILGKIAGEARPGDVFSLGMVDKQHVISQELNFVLNYFTFSQTATVFVVFPSSKKGLVLSINRPPANS